MTEKEKVLRRFERGRKAIIVASRASDAEEIAEKMDCSILEARKLIDWYEQNKKASL